MQAPTGRCVLLNRELLIGCGARRNRIISVEGRVGWESLTTLDINPDHNPDVLHDLERLPLPFNDSEFDEIHAYEVLEHTGRQGHYRFFFAQFSDFWRVLKPGGRFCATVPALTSQWLWGDPSHTRVIAPGTLVFLDQSAYADGVGKTAMSDFRYVYRADFEIEGTQNVDRDTFAFVLKAVKPSRLSVN